MKLNIQETKSNNKSMTYQKMQEIYQTLTTIINKEMFYQLDTNMIHRVRLISRMQLSNQETENIQLCSLKEKLATISQKMLRTSLMLIMTINKEIL